HELAVKTATNKLASGLTPEHTLPRPRVILHPLLTPDAEIGFPNQFVAGLKLEWVVWPSWMMVQSANASQPLGRTPGAISLAKGTNPFNFGVRHEGSVGTAVFTGQCCR